MIVRVIFIQLNRIIIYKLILMSNNPYAHRNDDYVDPPYDHLEEGNKSQGPLDHLSDGLEGQARTAFIGKVYILLSSKTNIIQLS